jgi:DNA polymerase III epsilon subunit family exonuclease
MGLGGPWAEVEFCVFDLETTGLKPEQGAEPIEVAGVRIVRGQIEDSFQAFVAPRGRIPRNVQELTGIRPDDVEEARSASEVLGDFLDFAGEAVLVAHNIDFDRGILDIYAPRPVDNDEIDTLGMARALLGQRDHSLDHLVRQFGLDRDEGHRALEDARATAELFRRLASRIHGYEDYCRCDIPRSVMREDLDLVLTVLDCSSREKEVLIDQFETTSDYLRLDEPELASTLDPDWEDVLDLRRAMKAVYEDPERPLKPPVNWTNSFKLRYWMSSNYLANGTGGLLLAGGLLNSASERFFALVLTSVPFFLASPLITYTREKNMKLILRGLVIGGLFLLWGLLLRGTGSLNSVLMEWQSILALGG